MRIARFIPIALTLAIGFPVVVSTGATAAVPVQCKVREIDPVTQELRCKTTAATPGASPVAGRRSSAPTSTPTAVWTRELNDDPDIIRQSANLCAPEGSNAPDDLGVLYRDTLRDTTTGEILDSRITCVPLNPDGGPAPPPAPPAPPTREELIDAAPVPTPKILVNPSGRGLTGMESWFWADNGGPVTASVTLRGWTVTGTLTATHWSWNTGDGGRYQATTPGSPQAPAIRHQWQTKNTWSVTLEVSWSGSYTISGYGTSFTVTGLTAEGTTTADYPVIEVRGVLDDLPAEE